MQAAVAHDVGQIWRLCTAQPARFQATESLAGCAVCRYGRNCCLTGVASRLCSASQGGNVQIRTQFETETRLLMIVNEQHDLREAQRAPLAKGRESVLLTAWPLRRLVSARAWGLASLRQRRAGLWPNAAV